MAPKVQLFVVHAPEDEAFVAGFLLPALGLAESEVLLSTRLELGARVVEEMVRGALSPVTVVVVSPSFLASPWAKLAEQLAMHQSVEAAEDGSASLVPAIVAECEVPLMTRFKVSLDFRKPEREHWESEVGRLRRKLASRETPPAPEAERCPYPGMRAFETREAADFHGRGQEVEEALMHVRGGARELYVIGPSGSGKSSLVAAGLVPRLLSAPALGGGRYVVRTMRPGAEPLAVLTNTLEAAADGEERPRWEAVVGQLLELHSGCDRLLLFIDQLEELFTTAKGAAREAFEAALRQLRGDGRVVLVLTLRADFYGALMESALWEDVGGRPTRLDVAPLRGLRVRQAIEAPARAMGVYFEAVLVERLLQEVEHEAGALPLLQDTLLQLWHRRTRGLVRLTDYEGLGEGGHSGLAVTVKHRADRTLNELTPARQQLAWRVLLRLVQLGEGDADGVTRRQQTRAALAASGDAAQEVDEVIRHPLCANLL